MSVYVDQPLFRLGRMKTCHLWADTVPELHDFVGRLDPRLLSHFQRPPSASWEHYDIGKGLRARAIALGAVETDRYGPVAHVARLKGDREGMARVERLRARRTAQVEAGSPRP